MQTRQRLHHTCGFSGGRPFTCRLGRFVRRWSSPLLLPKLGELDQAERSLFCSMANHVPASFLKWGCSAVLAWRPTQHHVPVFHIHGERDRLIPVHRVTPTQVVPGAGHLLSLTHPTQVTSFIGGVVQSVA